MYTRDVLPRAKAVCIGCNYPHSDRDTQLQGACNDARNWRNLLTHTYGIKPENCALLVDIDPNGNAMSKDDDTYPSQEAILDHLDWLVEDARPGDLLVLTFSGHGAQIPDVTGEEEDGMDEAICPSDFGEKDEHRRLAHKLITDDQFFEFFAHLPQGVHLTMVMDCSFGAGMLDGRESLGVESLDKEADQRWLNLPLTEKRKMLLSNPPNIQCRVRQAPVIAKKSWFAKIRNMFLPDVQGAMEQTVVGFCFGASEESQLACEVVLKEPGGVLTACMLSALAELNYGGDHLTYYKLLEEMEHKREQLMAKGYVPTLEQKFILNHTTEAEPYDTEFLMPIGKGLSAGSGAVKPQRKKKASDYCGFMCKQIGQQR
jgi:hypothetical protein